MYFFPLELCIVGVHKTLIVFSSALTLSTIRCLVYGDTFARSFKMQIQILNSLSKTRNKMHSKDIDAKTLDLYLVDIEIYIAWQKPSSP